MALKFLVSGFLIWFLTSGIDCASAAKRVAEADPVMLIAAVLVILIQICVGGMRWRAVLTEGHARGQLLSRANRYLSYLVLHSVHGMPAAA